MTRDEAINTLGNFKRYISGGGVTDRKANEAIDMAIEALQAEPVKHGEWVAAHIGETTSWYVECSKCHVVMPPVNYTYCPNCGAKMDKE